ncbi:hypothetical protein STEG23_038278 [Scotinomys teguina]
MKAKKSEEHWTNDTSEEEGQDIQKKKCPKKKTFMPVSGSEFFISKTIWQFVLHDSDEDSDDDDGYGDDGDDDNDGDGEHDDGDCGDDNGDDDDGGDDDDEDDD